MLSLERMKVMILHTKTGHTMHLWRKNCSKGWHNWYYGCDFMDCDNLIDVELPDTLIYIDDYAFCGCSELKHINFPEGLIIIEHDAFNECQLENVKFPNNLAYIGDYAFGWD